MYSEHCEADCGHNLIGTIKLLLATTTITAAATSIAEDSVFKNYSIMLLIKGQNAGKPVPSIFVNFLMSQLGLLGLLEAKLIVIVEPLLSVWNWFKGRVFKLCLTDTSCYWQQILYSNSNQ